MNAASSNLFQEGNMIRPDAQGSSSLTTRSPETR